MKKYLHWLIALPFILLILFNVFAYGSIISYRVLAPHRTAFMNRRMSQLSTQMPQIQLNYRWVAYNQISDTLKKSLIASEDTRFAQHSGFDWESIQAAIKRNEQAGKVRSGGSTITQQLAKNLFLNEKRSYFRKAQEAVFTAMIEATTNKQRIYTLYLNVIEWGYGVYGAQAASQYFYQKNAADLNKFQAAQLAARVPRPLFYINNPHDNNLNGKTSIILRRMDSATLPN